MGNRGLKAQLIYIKESSKSVLRLSILLKKVFF